MEYSKEVQEWLDKGNKIKVGKTLYTRKQQKEEKIRALKKELNSRVGFSIEDNGDVISMNYVGHFPSLFINAIVNHWNYKPLEGFISEWQSREKKSAIITYLIGTGLLKLKRNNPIFTNQ